MSITEHWIKQQIKNLNDYTNQLNTEVREIRLRKNFKISKGNFGW